MTTLFAHVGSLRGWLAGLARAIACLALLGLCAQASAQASAQYKYGRLFFTPDERRTLNEMRDDDIEPEQPEPERGQTVVAPVVDVISFDGKVERSGGGGSTIWVNGRAVFTGDRTVEGIKIESGRGTDAETRFELPPSDAGRTDFSLKVGQKIAVQSGKVLEPYESRAAEDAKSVFAEDAGEEAGDESRAAEGEAPAEGAPAPAGGS